MTSFFILVSREKHRSGELGFALEKVKIPLNLPKNKNRTTKHKTSECLQTQSFVIFSCDLYGHTVYPLLFQAPVRFRVSGQLPPLPPSCALDSFPNKKKKRKKRGRKRNYEYWKKGSVIDSRAFSTYVYCRCTVHVASPLPLYLFHKV